MVVRTDPVPKLIALHAEAVRRNGSSPDRCAARRPAGHQRAARDGLCGQQRADTGARRDAARGRTDPHSGKISHYASAAQPFADADRACARPVAAPFARNAHRLWAASCGPAASRRSGGRLAPALGLAPRYLGTLQSAMCWRTSAASPSGDHTSARRCISQLVRAYAASRCCCGTRRATAMRKSPHARRSPASASSAGAGGGADLVAGGGGRAGARRQGRRRSRSMRPAATAMRQPHARCLRRRGALRPELADHRSRGAARTRLLDPRPSLSPALLLMGRATATDISPARTGAAIRGLPSAPPGGSDGIAERLRIGYLSAICASMRSAPSWPACSKARPQAFGSSATTPPARAGSAAASGAPWKIRVRPRALVCRRGARRIAETCDVVVDIAGWTAGTRSQSSPPAAPTVKLGFAGTMGRWIDYIVPDRSWRRPGTRAFAERSSDCRTATRRPTMPHGSTCAVALRARTSGGFIFCSFSQRGR